jgi:hypothetical protein
MRSLREEARDEIMTAFDDALQEVLLKALDGGDQAFTQSHTATGKLKGG